MKFPDVIIAGFQKCGTTALWSNLSQHPELHAPLTPFNDSGWDGTGKELNFFTPEWSQSYIGKSESWYQAHFGDAPGLWYECSPNYAFTPDYCFKKIADTLDSSVRIIFAVRDPILRAYSAFNHYKEIYPISREWGWDRNKSFLWNHENTNAFSWGDYSTAIKTCQQFIDPANIHIVVQECLSNTPQKEYDRLFKFLGVKTYPIENSYLNQHQYRKVKPRPDDSTIEELSKYYSPYNEALFEILGFRVEQWL